MEQGRNRGLKREIRMKIVIELGPLEREERRGQGQWEVDKGREYDPLCEKENHRSIRKINKIYV